MKSFAEASLQIGKFAVTTVVFVAGELPLRVLGGLGQVSTLVFERAVVKPLELGVAIFATGMEIVAHTIALFMLGFVFLPLVLPMLILAPVFLPLMIPVVVMSAMFRALVSPYRIG